MKERIEELLRSTNREGIEGLLEYMDKHNFYSAPCSTQFHLNKLGGLAEHSLNVYEYMHKFNIAVTDIESITYDEWSVIIVSLLHDIGKMGHHNKPMYVDNILKSGKQSTEKPYLVNKDLTPVPHEVESIAIITRFIELTEEEEYAILIHNAMYGDFRYAINGKERPLQTLLHFADLWCARFVEK